MDARPVDDPPHSTENYDDGALLPEQQRQINERKVAYFDPNQTQLSIDLVHLDKKSY